MGEPEQKKSAMSSLDQLKKFTTVVADSGDIQGKALTRRAGDMTTSSPTACVTFTDRLLNALRKLCKDETRQVWSLLLFLICISAKHLPNASLLPILHFYFRSSPLFMLLVRRF